MSNIFNFSININNEVNYYFHLIFLSIINEIKHIIFVLTKSIDEGGNLITNNKSVEKLKNFIEDL